MGDAEVPFPTSEVHFVDQAVGTFIAWSTHLVRKVTNEDSQKPPPKSVEQPEKGTGVAKDDALVQLVKKLYVVYQKPIELSWDGARFGLPNAKNGFFITHADVTKIILGNTFLNISILQLWMIAMKNISSTFKGKENGPAPQWIEPKSHVQAGGYECGYYVMHWMWCIISGGLKNEWNTWFFDGSPLDSDTMTTLRKKWAAYFLQVAKLDVSVIRIMVGPFTGCLRKTQEERWMLLREGLKQPKESGWLDVLAVSKLQISHFCKLSFRYVLSAYLLHLV
ncbi:hypothetical protein JHK85_000434 [Glycine max]|nr:hypothetical protein JHK85_000434 [Glycine max]KAG5087816.1 hypothetical protein JHK86_000428 [Glycine max]KHN01195.1 hypothetical protein glysoja_008097 [Glycine soja]